MDTLHFALTEVHEATAASLTQVYFDFIVSGNSLSQLLQLEKAHKTSILYPHRSDKVLEHVIKLFLGVEKSLLNQERTCFYVCAECGNLACGAITATIEIHDTTVIWKDFGWNFGDDEPDVPDDEPVGPFVFDRVGYSQAFTELRSQLLSS
ncbi:hypothetical protein EJV47_10510 [Hymenobacter gummosus]|uniref:Uncharacterized protein n=1 Tax=Hymenobacter gummosus TaxID=1776032 RepID=A0A3S0JAI0_9BACT|nr:hypothetical protein [Hymenobacter gummosus]RTQ50064.1 hypothetical protein EJV47_10510 [Hymenobacter gummosus]